MRYLDELLGEAKTKKSAFKTIEKIKKTKEKLVGRSIDAEDASEKAFDRGDDEEAYKQGDRHHNAMQRSARLSVFADKVKKKAYLKGGGKGDGKPKGKLRLVQHAAYIQLGDIIAEAMKIPKKYLGAGDYIPGPYNSRSRKLNKIKNKLDVQKRDSEAQASREMSPTVASLRAAGIKPRVDAYSIEKKAREDNPKLKAKRDQYYRVSYRHNKRLQAFDDKIRAILRNTEG